MTDLDALADEAVAAGRAAGLVAVGVTSAEPFRRSKDAIEQHRDAGRHGGMAFTYRSPARSCDPRSALPSARAIVAGAWSYAGPTPARPTDRPTGRVARYAWDDHYADLRAALGAVAEVLRAAGHRGVVVADRNEVVDRAAAHRAGLGWWGRNTNILRPEVGGWIVLGQVVTDAPLPDRGHEVDDGCRSCTRCVPACPTGALSVDGVLDARRCLAWTVQTSDTIPRAQRIALGDRVYGCDDCLDACPPGRRAVAGTTTAVAAPRRRAEGTDPAPHRGPWVDVRAVLAAGDDELLATYGRWYIPRRDPAHLRRNAVVVLGNIGDPDDADDLAALDLALADRSPVVRAHAVWAAARLGRSDRVAAAAADPDPMVRAEVAQAPAVPPVAVRSGSA